METESRLRDRIVTLLDRLDARWIVLIALGLRLGWLLFCNNPTTSDTFIYHDSAIHIAAGDGFLDESGNPQGWWPVGYPALLAPFYRIFGASTRVAHVVNAFLGALAVFGVFKLGRSLFGERAGRAAASIVAIYPTFVMYTTCIASENAVLAGLPWLLWLFVLAARTGSWPLTALSGVLLAAGAYVRAPTLFVAATLPLLALLFRRGWIDAAARGALVVAVAVALLVPWGLRNQRAFGRFSLVSMNGSSNLWMGNHPGSNGGYAPLPDEFEGVPLVVREDELGARAKRFIKEHPGQFAVLTVKRLWLTLRSDTIAAEWNTRGMQQRFGRNVAVPAKMLCTAAYYLLWVGALSALVMRARRRLWGWQDWYLLALVGLLAFPFVVIVGGNRYHLPMLPLLAIWTSAHLAKVEPTSQAG